LNLLGDVAMGLNVRFLKLMIWLKEQGYIAPGQRVAEIGAQQLNNYFLKATDDIKHLSQLFNVAVPSLPSPIGDGPDQQLNPSAPRAEVFYRSLGFDYSCVDIDNNPSSISLDLNFDTAPTSLTGKFNLVTNFGTTEHVVNQLNAFKLIHDLAAPGAIMLHELPVLDQLNHGFFGYQPKFFYRLARCNEYSTLILDFSWSDVEYGLPDDMRYALAESVDIKDRPRYGNAPSAVTAVLCKTRDAPFVPPIDVPYGSEAPNLQMKQRYGNAFYPLPSSARIIGRASSFLAKVIRRLNS
jgi:hypothetical protein